MASASLSAASRTDTGKGVARKLRAAGRVPAVVYGHGRAPQSLALDTREVERLLDKIVAASTVIDLSIDGKSAKTLIRDIQRDPLRRAILHIDFQELVAGEKITVRVPVKFEGIPVGVRANGGLLEEIMHEIEIEVDPTALPEMFVVDVVSLTIGHSIHARDIALPAGVTLLTDADATVCLVSAPRAAVEAAADAPTGAEPEVIRKAKADEAAEK
jgi:large subunit ribosomal protein L25